ncbi:hypothetical protein [Rickettsia endosymbiont of Orchestes rusci]|uniref:hypothetical protein n=1 Tax=Rickettsia endosymbiont of Orchestes rusci TaxID=3066250 RepID=UPI00313E8730
MIQANFSGFACTHVLLRGSIKAAVCHSCESRNPVKHIKNLFFICLFYQIYNFCTNIKVILSGFLLSQE